MEKKKKERRIMWKVEGQDKTKKIEGGKSKENVIGRRYKAKGEDNRN